MLLFLPALTGLLLIACFPHAGQGYLAWVAFIPLIVYVFLSKSRFQAFWGGFIAGFTELFVLLIWMPPVLVNYGGLHEAMAWVAYGLLVAVLGCYPAIACGVTKHFVMRGGNRFLLLFPAVWILSEYALTLSPFGGFPWLLTGYTQANYLGIIQISDITGVYGISFLVLWVNSAIAWIFLRRRSGGDFTTPLTAMVLIATILLGTATLAYGAISHSRWSNDQQGYRAAMLQMNISADDPAQALAEKYRQGYFAMADGLDRAKVDLLVFPESPLPISFQYDSAYRQSIGDLARRFPLGIIFNNINYIHNGEETRYFNSAFYLDGNGTLKAIYDKIHLVPFGEYIPLKRFFSFVETISKDVGEFSPGKDKLILKIADHPSNVIICFEAIFPGLVRRFANDGSQLIINLTNDGWYGRSSAPYQHLAIARLRAVENRRYLIRAANSGFSALIEPTGRIQTSSKLFREAVCEGQFAFVTEKTLYTRYGDVLVFLCAIISFGLLVFVEIRKAAGGKRQTREEMDARRTE